jgi:hypothetical protein
MKTNIKKFVAGLMVVSSLLPALAFAEGNENEGKKGDNFCARLSTITLKSSEKEANWLEREAKHKGDQEEKMQDRKAKMDAKRYMGRSDEGIRKSERFEKLTAKATTDAQKAAVEAYKTAITNAMTARKTAIDVALAAFNTGANATITAHNTAMKTATDAFKAATKAAMDKAVADCALPNADSKAIKTAFNTSMKDAKVAFSAAVKNIKIDTKSLSELRKTLKEATSKAEADFLTAKKAAHAILVEAMKA